MTFPTLFCYVWKIILSRIIQAFSNRNNGRVTCEL